MKPITRVKCIWPFTKLTVHHHGYCYSCCGPWTKLGNVGRLTTQDSIMDIWNNERMQYIRKAILDDELWKVCNFKYCPFAIKNEYLYIETMKTDDPNYNHIIDEIVAGKTIMDNPPYVFEVANSGKCNLKCIMCQSNDQYLKYNEEQLEERLFTKIIPEILPGISLLSLAANGEVLFNPHSRKFLQSLDCKNYQSLKIDLVTNGTLFTPKLWESIRHNRYGRIFVSVDAASKKTYEKIRRNGNWDILRRNLDFMSKLRRENLYEKFAINFTVMKSNYKEMKAFVKLGLELGCDTIVFQKIFGLADAGENINFTNNKKVFAEIAKILTDPIFSRPEVDITLIEEYRKYLNKSGVFGGKFITKGKEWLLYIPLKAIFTLAKHFSFVIHIYEFARKKRIPVRNQMDKDWANNNPMGTID